MSGVFDAEALGDIAPFAATLSRMRALAVRSSLSNMAMLAALPAETPVQFRNSKPFPRPRGGNSKFPEPTPTSGASARINTRKLAITDVSPRLTAERRHPALNFFANLALMKSLSHWNGRDRSFDPFNLIHRSNSNRASASVFVPVTV